MNRNNERSNEKDRLIARPDEPLPTVQDPQQHENPKDPKQARKSQKGPEPNAADIDYTA
jgi:hypothetical protein